MALDVVRESAETLLSLVSERAPMSAGQLLESALAIGVYQVSPAARGHRQGDT